ncbi:hypothetical protein [Novosphingobium beihaiensis]|uniref:Uncharacterized protein n=1 Tax=Novosphingobium beihaiensis TaxID=2930389 RepID=A0ABT0BP40_9SPHN|nr:hypothetical protein [Novosphingobium beihaiensis]MCJ2186807.1 hypothetical protein [Novosphingobium beihaiensis]
MTEFGRRTGGFGKRRIDGLSGVSTANRSSATAQPRGVTNPAQNSGSGDKVTGRHLISAAILLVFGVILLEAAFAETSLITPINPLFLWTMRGIGALVGLALGIFTLKTSNSHIFKRVVSVLFLPFMVAFLFDGIAWRMADWWEFPSSAALWEPMSYPVLRAHQGRKAARNTLEIDPFGVGETTDIPVPRDQFRQVYSGSGNWCVTVLQRRSPRGAIEIRTDGRYTLKPPEPVDLHRCSVWGASPGGRTP